MTLIYVNGKWINCTWLLIKVGCSTSHYVLGDGIGVLEWLIHNFKLKLQSFFAKLRNFKNTQFTTRNGNLAKLRSYEKNQFNTGNAHYEILTKLNLQMETPIFITIPEHPNLNCNKKCFVSKSKRNNMQKMLNDKTDKLQLNWQDKCFFTFLGRNQAQSTLIFLVGLKSEKISLYLFVNGVLDEIRNKCFFVETTGRYLFYIISMVCYSLCLRCSPRAGSVGLNEVKSASRNNKESRFWNKE